MRIVLRILNWVAIVLLVAFIGIQFIRPARTNPATDESQTLQTRLQVPPEVSAILDRSCRDCHSNKTDWPWYTQITPLSWWIVDHVNHGRKELNLSEWGKLPSDRQDRKLRQICDEVQEGNMPLPSYLPMHPSAKLSDTDKQALCGWTQKERERLGNTK